MRSEAYGSVHKHEYHVGRCAQRREDPFMNKGTPFGQCAQRYEELFINMKTMWVVVLRGVRIRL